ncbi:Putative 4,5-dihydroxyphthalate dehydrogenase [Lacunisphaera limnophila]|uniref:4,5-dihydroxyphthalate dehydrogenase n=1 Tax=Lacunisphaera limnophila TaxID=1838286 RepID=A0A1D8AYG8_9BACT|nr:Gfo/Idh/MocA family oxidoreductase [Lacunisphaera limnophila]AOS45936.1 Putative 4,5-dihydroxyphthalate dehydrogenase [Lacunisphaera limnophila]
MNRSLARRDFIKTSALAAAGLVLPALTACRSPGSRPARRPAPGSRVNVGLVGYGTIAHSTTPNFLSDPRVQIVAVADPVNELPNYGYRGELQGGRQVGKRAVDAHYAEQTKGANAGCKVYEDFRDMFAREDLDAVVVSTPDHWHCAVALLAAQRGLHVYGQKPLTLTVGEGRRMADAVKAHGIVWQTGSQQRSSVYFRTACEFIRNGRIGRVTGIKVGLPGGHTNWSKLADRTQPETPPAGVNFDLWLGPAPERPYVPALFQLNWRHNYAFSGGMITDWGAHHLDIVQWALGMDGSGPSRIEIRSVTQPEATALYNTSTAFDFDVIYGSGVRVNVSNAHPNGILFEGEDGRSLFVSRDTITTTPAELRRERIKDGEIRLPESKVHEHNFIDGILNRTETITPIETGHRSITIPHLANIAIRLGRSALDWDPAVERFVNDPAADAMLQRPMRRGYAV